MITKPLILFFIGCACMANAPIKSSRKFFKVTEATVQSWSAGANRKDTKVQGGLIYQVKVTVVKDNRLRLDSLFVNGNLLPVEIVKGNERNFAGSLLKGDQIVVLARTENGETQKRASEKLFAALTKEEGQGFLVYRVNGKPCISLISKFTEVSNQSKNQ